MIVLVVALVALREKRTTTITADGSSSSGKRSTSSTSRSAPSTSTSRTSSPPRTSPTASAPSTPADTGATSSTALKAVPLVVLNNTQTPNLARDAAQRFQSGGWTVTSTGNLTNDIISTCAYYDPDVADAKAAARALRKQFPTIKRVEPKFAELPAGPIVVVLTPDYSSS